MTDIASRLRVAADMRENHMEIPDSYLLREAADVIDALTSQRPVVWSSYRELTVEEVRAEKALYKLFARTPGRANTPFSAWKARAAIAVNSASLPADAHKPDAAAEDRKPDLDKVICPGCTHQFRAIPVDVQMRLFALERLAASPARVGEGHCQWTYDDDGFWNQECGGAWSFTEGGPDENNCRFCPSCGKTIDAAMSREAQDT